MTTDKRIRILCIVLFLIDWVMFFVAIKYQYGFAICYCALNFGLLRFFSRMKGFK